MPSRPRPEEAAISVQRALLNCVGPGAAESLGLAQAQLAWLEVVEAAGLSNEDLYSRLVRVTNGTATVEANEPILAQELALRADALAAAVNRRQAGRPGAIYEVRRVTVTVRPGLAAG
jgi:hypothetical protein